jgi:hypothetical protein
MPPTLHRDPQTGTVTLTNGRLRLTIATRPAYNPHRLVDLDTGRAYADSDYLWPGRAPAVLVGEPGLTTAPDGSGTAIFTVAHAGLELTHSFSLPAGEPGVLAETLTLRNPGLQPADTVAFACGFAKRVQTGDDGMPEVTADRLCELPYRCHPETGELRDFSLPTLFDTPSWYSPVRSPIYNRQTTAAYGSEAWAWYDGTATLLLSKYNALAMEWSVIEPVTQPAGKLLRFGGAARWKLGDPEGAARLAPGASFAFGQTRYQLLTGAWPQAFAAFRQFTERQGHRLPPDYNPPVHWNELYDNPYFWTVLHDSFHLDRPERRAALYGLKDMQIEIDKAAEIGCDCFYMDPGWDTDFASSIWDEARLGRQADFAQRLRTQYGMALALHTPLAPWSNNASYPLEARQMGPDGQRRADLCVASAQYLDLKARRLIELVRNGAYFLMFDGSWYDQRCYDTHHGHGAPSTRQEHVDAILSLAQRVHAACPAAVIEQHDPITGPGTPRYAPTYFMHGRPGAFDELWGFEYMLDALADLHTRRAFALYYYNLAYSIPVYLHFDLRTDNAEAVGFWWFASTCRHLGFGGQPADPAVWAAHQRAMRLYLAHKQFFTQGVFTGVDELTHAHTLPGGGAAIFNCFNLDATPVTRAVSVPRAVLGLAAGPLTIQGAAGQAAGEVISFAVTVPAMGHALVRVQALGPA